MKNKIAFWTITSILTVVLVFVLVTTVILPVFTKETLPKGVVVASNDVETKAKPKNKAKSKENQKVEEEQISSDSEISENKNEAGNNLFELRKKEILLRSRLKLAKEDSMYLVLDVTNRKATIEMKGVVLHEFHIFDLKVSNAIKLYKDDHLINWMGDPFTLQHSEVTISKVSFVEKIAPKDTIEANKTEAEPQAKELEDFYAVLDFNRNLRMVISQNEQPSVEGKILIDQIKQKYSKGEIRKSLQSLIKFNREPVMPQIDLVLSKTEATILYRALPLYMKIIVTM